MGGKSSKSKNTKIIRKKIVVIGLEAVGKTTLVQKLKYGQA
jgi:GTPase SAR1 family protein